MEGVVVSAKKKESTVTVSVISDAQGRYSFPADRLGAGQYSLKIRAAGYDLIGSPAADVQAEQTTTVDLKLRKTKNLASQLDRLDSILDGLGYKKGSDGIRVANGSKMSYNVITPTDVHSIPRTFQIIQAAFHKIGIELKRLAERSLEIERSAGGLL